MESNIFSLSTAYQKSAIALIRISGGSDIFNLIASIFSNQKIIDGPGYKVYYGFLEKDKKIIDEVLITKFAKPHSYTGENMLEISLHGSLPTVDEISEILIDLGFCQALKGEFSKRAFLNGKASLSKLEAVNAIINSQSTAEKDSIINNLTSYSKDYIQNIKAKLLKIVSTLTVSIDYPDEEIIQDTDINTDEIYDLIFSLEKVIKNYNIKTVYQEGIRVVVAGQVNVGKSSFFNEVLKFKRAIVSDIPGTTTDYIEHTIEYKGFKIVLFDTAGIRKTENKIESQGIHHSFDVIKKSDIVLYMLDSTKNMDLIDTKNIDFLKSMDKNLILILSKIDISKSKKDGFIGISNLTKEGINDVFEKVISQIPKIDTEYLVPSSTRQLKLLNECLEHIKIGLQYLKDNVEEEFLLFEFQSALSCVGKIIGEVSQDDILDEVFSNFCVGK